MRRIPVMLAVVAIVMSITSAAFATTTNHVSYWCDAGEKFEPVDTPFIVPVPPDGQTYSLLVIKAGSGPDENYTWDYPVVAQGYSHPSGKDNSHAILCLEETSTTTTTVPVTTTTLPATTTTSTTVTSTTTIPDTTTTTDPVTTTSLTTSTIVETTTTSPLETTTTDPGSTTTTVPELPNTGAPLWGIGLVAAMFITLGGLTLWRTSTN